jgi:flagellar motor protein MotB
MSMTCLTPNANARYDLYALLYELNPEGTTLTGTGPLGATLVNLSKCPTASTWRNKTFKAADFSMMPMSFNNAQVTAGKFYGVYMTGAGMPGTLPPGAAAAMAAAKAATTTTTVPPTTTTTTPWSRFKGESNRTATAPSASPTASVAPSVSNALTVLGATRINRSAVRLMSPALSKKNYINSLTPKVCLGAGRNLVFLRTGRCTARVQLRSNGKLVSTVTTRVVSGEVVASDEVVPVAPATVAYFRSGTGLTTTATKKAIAALAPTARAADAILVTGHTGNIQSENSNLMPLSQKRAQAVRSLLRDRGVRTTVAIWSYGASQPVSKGKTAKEQNLNRRAEIFIIP